MATPPPENMWVQGELIGAGYLGKVYIAMDPYRELIMAVKQIECRKGNDYDQEMCRLRAFEKEVERLRLQIQHPNVVKYLPSPLDDESGVLNIFMEYLPGGSVASLLQKNVTLGEALAQSITGQALEGLRYLHTREIVHGDIKASNILLDDKRVAKISDVGLLPAASQSSGSTISGTIHGIPPELIAGKVKERTKKGDVWSIGCLVVKMLTGRRTWGDSSMIEVMLKLAASSKPEIPDTISSAAQDFLRKALEVDPELRSSASDLLEHPWLLQSVQHAN
ncbi:kinase-like domain-containing protein [Coprinopsis sp. MPI-PUGE-AT-0042]|nr:kinase-like domain-containing protein [Coprinopsis sp. MPI-PUGE-AT-0042]